MGTLRVGCRIAGMAIFILTFYVVWMTGRLFAWTPSARVRWRRFAFRTWARCVARMFGMRIKVQGEPPKPPFFLVTNHLTYMDGLTIASVVGGEFIAKSEVAHWPAIGFFARQVNAIFVDRSKRSDTVRVNGLIKEAMDRGDGVVMFAESTTSRGDTILPFKTALFAPAVDLELPVHYATIHYGAPPGLPPATAWITWWEDISFGAHFARMAKYPGFDAVLTFGAEPIAADDRKVLAESLYQACMQQFVPME